MTRSTGPSEKHDGQWKLVCTMFLHQTFEESGPPLFQVDGDRRILWQNAAGLALLGRAASVTSRNGRLIVVPKDAHRQFERAIRLAAGLEKFLDHEASAIPILIGGERGGKVLVLLDDSCSLTRRLKLATQLYGISARQSELAGLIISGLTLGKAAEQLGISVHTARTQLQRMFEKVGVRSQPALVRVLLSSTVPRL